MWRGIIKMDLKKTLEFIEKWSETFSSRVKRIPEDWIKKNVRFPKNNCFFYAGALAALFPHQLKLMAGPPLQKGDSAHFWTVTKDDGQIIDPTIMYENPDDYNKGKEISLTKKKNIEYLVKDPLFQTLREGDRISILTLWQESKNGE